jgi:hypothetical protein
MSLQFALASTITHELAHVWFGRWSEADSERWGINQNHLEYRVYETDAIPEAGFSWETATFGAHIGFLGGNPETYIGLIGSRKFQYQWPINTAPLWAFVPKEWILQWFRVDTWRNIKALKARGDLDPPCKKLFPELFPCARYIKANLRQRWVVL